VRSRQLLLFGLVGANGTLVNTAVLWLLHSVLGLHYLAAAALATECAIVHNFLGNEHLTFAGERPAAGRAHRFGRFQLVSLATLVGTVGLLGLLVHVGGERLVLVWNVAAIGVMFVLNFALNRSLTWRRPAPVGPAVPPPGER
jgi:dolichol-phosphate mannosyltransferase